MRRFLSLSEPWAVPLGRRIEEGVRFESISSSHYHNASSLSPHRHCRHLIRSVPRQKLQKCLFHSHGGGLQRNSLHIQKFPFDRVSLESVSLDNESTIYALSTAPGRAAIAIIRISGPACLQIYRALCPQSRDPKPRSATVRALYDPTQDPSPNTLLDSGALILYFPNPRTVTGEDILELHVHGGSATLKAVLAAIEKCNTSIVGGDVRYAEPGEFTRRAFMNDRLDLPQIEALGDTLHAETEQQRRLAVRGVNNVLSQRYEDWRQQLLYARGELEALIDFSEDQHFDESPQELIGSVAAQVDVLRRQIDFHIRNASKGELLRNGIKIALLGAPNAGKSSLLNRVVGKEAAIVSTEEGTTRDIVDVVIDLDGWCCRIGDMAGLRSSPKRGAEKIGAIELEGIRRAKQRALESDVVVVVLSVQEYEDGTTSRLAVDPEVIDAVRACQEHGKSIVVVINKSDKLPAPAHERASALDSLSKQVSVLFEGLPENRIYSISCKEAEDDVSVSERSLGLEQSTGLGSSIADPGNIQSFLRGLISVFEEIARPEGTQEGDETNDTSYWEDSLGVTHRQQSNLKQCLEHLERFLTETKTRKTATVTTATTNTYDMENQQSVYNNNNNNTSANADLKVYTDTCSRAHTHAHAHVHKMQIPAHRKSQKQTPSNAVYNDNEEECKNSEYNNGTVMTSTESDVDIVTAAENLRSAAESLAQITGRGGGDVEDVLGVVFEKFCVGK